MQLAKSASTLALFVLALAAPASAQQNAAPAQTPFRGYLIGGAGAAVSGQTSPTLSAELAETIGTNVQVYTTFAYYDDLMSDAARAELQSASLGLSAFTGTPWSFSGRDRGRAFTVGAKYLISASGTVRPYIGGGFGALNLRRTIREQSRGNLTDAYLSEFGAGDGVIDPSQTNTTKPLGEVAAGVGVIVGRAYVDFGYRYKRAFHTVGESFDFSQLGASVGVKF